MEDVLFWIAIVSSLAFSVKLLLMILGLEVESDVDGGDVFSINFVLAFLMSQSWSALAFIEQGRGTTTAIILSVLVATAFAGAFVFFMSRMRKLESRVIDGLGIEPGDKGEVFLTVPKSGTGKVKVSINGTTMNLNATSQQVKIPTGTQVEVVEIHGETLVVKPL